MLNKRMQFSDSRSNLKYMRIFLYAAQYVSPFALKVG